MEIYENFRSFLYLKSYIECSVKGSINGKYQTLSYKKNHVMFRISNYLILRDRLRKYHQIMGLWRSAQKYIKISKRNYSGTFIGLKSLNRKLMCCHMYGTIVPLWLMKCKSNFYKVWKGVYASFIHKLRSEIHFPGIRNSS